MAGLHDRRSGAVRVLVVALCSAAVFIWLERKVSARIQDRLGPTRVGGRFGWLQPPADGIKLLCKEDIIPAAADRPLFRIAPVREFLRHVLRVPRLPFANGWVALELNAGAFFVLAVAGLEVFGVILGGYASGSKWSLYGAMREAAQVVSYEIPLGLCVVVPVLLAGTMDLVAIGNARPAGSTTGTSSTTRSRSSRSGSTSRVPWPARIGRRSTCPRPRANWWPASSPSIPASAG